MTEENKSISDLVAEGKAFEVNDAGKIKELPDVLKTKINEFITWAELDRAYEVLNAQEEHDGLVIAGTEENPSPYNDLAILINKTDPIISILVACKVVNKETNEQLEGTVLMVLNTNKDDLTEVFAVEAQPEETPEQE